MGFVAVTRTIQRCKQGLLINVAARAKPRVLEDRTKPSGFARHGAKDRLARVSLSATLRDFMRKNSGQHSSHHNSVLTGPHELVQWQRLQKLHERPVCKWIGNLDSELFGAPAGRNALHRR